MYFVWYDESKKPVVDKIQDATDAYVGRFHTRPSLVLVNAVDYLVLDTILVRAEQTVQPNTFWLGRADGTDMTRTQENASK